VRIALIANEASGGGLDPEPLAAAMRRHGADVSVHGLDDLGAVPGAEPERIAVAGGDGTIAEQRDVCHARGHVIEVDLPPGTEFNVDGEVRDDGMQRITVEHEAFELVVG
jgi:diacylglycerol kinase family enzyme